MFYGPLSADYIVTLTRKLKTGQTYKSCSSSAFCDRHANDGLWRLELGGEFVNTKTMYAPFRRSLARRKIASHRIADACAATGIPRNRAAVHAQNAQLSRQRDRHAGGDINAPINNLGSCSFVSTAFVMWWSPKLCSGAEQRVVGVLCLL